MFVARDPSRLPTAPTMTSLARLTFVLFSDEIQDEDIRIREVAQKNLRSRVYDRGGYSAAQENDVHHFRSLLHEFLT
jgi:phenylpropionate dioxygenase-like ring-hydroxylating dioxygenase large terminal subunit